MSISKVLEGKINLNTGRLSGIFTFALEESTKGIAILLHHASLRVPIGFLIELL
jgi:hypothetical protein